MSVVWEAEEEFLASREVKVLRGSRGVSRGLKMTLLNWRVAAARRASA